MKVTRSTSEVPEDIRLFAWMMASMLSAVNIRRQIPSPGQAANRVRSQSRVLTPVLTLAHKQLHTLHFSELALLLLFASLMSLSWMLFSFHRNQSEEVRVVCGPVPDSIHS